ncbi:hypothetical protein Syun_012043 [Stephania yunnanensis]|uniref:Uncharacterized protein n=1 Tax=Stephania yunnanensis TaxID=152371 RepID=A0AAP0PEX2_9MAGN
MVRGGKGRSSREEKGKAQLVEKPKQKSKAPPKPIRPMRILENNPELEHQESLLQPLVLSMIQRERKRLRRHPPFLFMPITL